MAKILVVEDDESLRKVLSEALQTQHHTTDSVADGKSGLAYIKGSHYDLIILDWELPGCSGIDICREYRKNGGNSPVLFLTARGQINEKAQGFEVGADDYLVKPFLVQELLLRVRALLRRPAQVVTDVLRFSDLTLDPETGKVELAGAEIKLQRRELALLEFFMRHPAAVFSAESLLVRVWDTDSDATEIALRSCIAKIRKKLDREGKPSIIESIWGKGYKFNPPD